MHKILIYFLINLIYTIKKTLFYFHSFHLIQLIYIEIKINKKFISFYLFILTEFK